MKQWFCFFFIVMLTLICGVNSLNPSFDIGKQYINAEAANVAPIEAFLNQPTNTLTLPLEFQDIATSQPHVTNYEAETVPVSLFTQTMEPISGWRPPLYPVPWMPTPYDHFFFTRPIAAIDLKWILANYRYGGVFIPGVVHTGIDIPVKTGTKVYAAGPGRVNWVGYGLLAGKYDPEDPYGLAVVIRHDFGYQGQTLYTVYGHLSRADVIRGQIVETGDLLGLSGATGQVTGAHLHFEVRIGRNSFSRSRNPELWISPAEGWGIIAGRIKNVFGELIYSTEVQIRSVETGQKWNVATYGNGAANRDPYYIENVVIGDLPAGLYTIWIISVTSTHTEIEVLPGRVSYFSFQNGIGFQTELPPEPRMIFKTPLPPEQSPVP